MNIYDKVIERIEELDTGCLQEHWKKDIVIQAISEILLELEWRIANARIYEKN